MARLFVALDLPDPVKQALDALCQGVEGARWVRDGQFHLTLSFLGELNGPDVANLTQGLGGVRADPFELRLEGIGHFPPRGRPRVLWAGVEKSAELEYLHRRLLSRMRRIGYEGEGRKFAPHVTLARLRDTPLPSLIRYMEDHMDFVCPAFPVVDFQLFSSVLGRSGAVYRVEASYPLFGDRGV